MENGLGLVTQHFPTVLITTKLFTYKHIQPHSPLHSLLYAGGIMRIYLIHLGDCTAPEPQLSELNQC